MLPSPIRTLLLSSLAVLLSSCGGGSSNTATNTMASAVASTTISGNVVKGPVNGATVTVKAASTGQLLGTTVTGAGGAYSVAIPFNGDVVVEVVGGSYTDEATGANTALTVPLKVVLNASGGNLVGVVTPLTTMAFNQAFPATNTVINIGAFNAMSAKLATQFQLGSVNLSTTTPTVSGSMNDYGRVLAGLSKYLQTNNTSLQTLVGSSLNSAQWAQFSDKFTSAYRAAHPGSNLTYAINGNTLSIGGTGLGGSSGGVGSASCGVSVKGATSQSGTSLPLDLNFCVSGLAQGACTSGSDVLARAMASQPSLAGAMNLQVTASETCAPGSLKIQLQ